MHALYVIVLSPIEHIEHYMHALYVIVLSLYRTHRALHACTVCYCAVSL